jgi:hypothetical protein
MTGLSVRIFMIQISRSISDRTQPIPSRYKVQGDIEYNFRRRGVIS